MFDGGGLASTRLTKYDAAASIGRKGITCLDSILSRMPSTHFFGTLNPSIWRLEESAQRSSWRPLQRPEMLRHQSSMQFGFSIYLDEIRHGIKLSNWVRFSSEHLLRQSKDMRLSHCLRAAKGHKLCYSKNPFKLLNHSRVWQSYMAAGS